MKAFAALLIFHVVLARRGAVAGEGLANRSIGLPADEVVRLRSKSLPSRLVLPAILAISRADRRATSV